MLLTSCVPTDTRHENAIPSVFMHEMEATPDDTPVTTPSEVIVATEGLLLLHVNFTPESIFGENLNSSPIIMSFLFGEHNKRTKNGKMGNFD